MKTLILVQILQGGSVKMQSICISKQAVCDYLNSNHRIKKLYIEIETWNFFEAETLFQNELYESGDNGCFTIRLTDLNQIKESILILD